MTEPTAERGSFWGSPPAEPETEDRERGARGGSTLRWITRERPLSVPPAMARWLTFGVLLAIYTVLLAYYRPDLLLSVTTTTGGDTGAHVYAPWYLKNHLLPDGMLTGWSPGWYGGFPILHFYFPLVATFQALASFAIPYEVAFKLGSVLGPLFLPVAAYFMFRLIGFSFPTPHLAAVAALLFLFMDSFTIYGGNIPSSLAGEYSFSLSMGLSLVFIGLAWRIATGARAWPVAAVVVLALAVLSHLLPVVMIATALPVILFVAVRERGARRAAISFDVLLGVAFCLTAWWSIPFLARLPYTADMAWFPLEGLGPIAPRELWPYLAGFAVAAIVALLRMDRRFLVLAVPAVFGVVIFLVLPQGPVWNGRFLPFWYLGAHLATAYVIGTMLPFAARTIWRRRMDVFVVATAAVLAVGAGGWLLLSRGSTFIDDWIRANYQGYEASQSWGTFERLMQALDRLPPGRVMWEPNSELGRFGTTVAFMTIPYWTDQPTMEGIYFESSITTPFHFVLASEVAERPSNPIPGLPYSEFDLEAGIDHMELLDIRYFLAFTQLARDAGAESDRLEVVGRIDDFTIFELEPSGPVVVPEHEPVVLDGADWIEENLAWFGGRNLDVPMASDGPEGWARVDAYDASLPRTELPDAGAPVEVAAGDREITFTTEAVGVPHWIKTSYFPNWRAEGADGPYLASPSMMMVVPTQERVRLSYERTWAEWLGLTLTLGAIVALSVPPVRRRLRREMTG